MGKDNIKFSVVIPTSIDRGLILPHSIASVQRQSIQDFEILIIGDGTNTYTKEVIGNLQKTDPRIRFFDFPKHPRRGEENRHKILTEEAKGKYIAYLCDRDIWLPHHLQTLDLYLEKHDFASTLNYQIIEGQERMILGYKNINKWNASAWFLSCTGHRMDFYKKLPYGWRTTPLGQFTDIYMWEQFIKHPKCKTYCGLEPTVLWFKRGHFPGMSTEERKKELVRWEEILEEKFLFQSKKDDALEELMLGFNYMKQNLFVRVKGRKLSQMPQELLLRLKKALSLG